MQKRIRFIKIIYFLHSIFYFLLDIIHLIIFIKLIWISKLSKKIYYIEIFILCGFSFVPIILLLNLLYLKLTKQLFIRFQLLSRVLLILIFFNGIIISLNICNNAIALTTFFYYCPFNYNVNDLNKIFNNYKIENEKEINNKCNNRRCFINTKYVKNNYIIDNYICNFYNKEKLNYCYDLIINRVQITNELINYINYCKSYTEMYFCERQKNVIYYGISYDYKCPNEFDIFFNFFLFFLFIIIDVFGYSIPWILENYAFNEIIFLLTFNINGINQNNNNSLKETNNTSKISNNDNSNGSRQENNNEIFQRQSTKTIIIYNNNNKENKFNSNRNYFKNNNDILIINRNKINKNNNSIENISNNKEIFDQINYESENQLISNKNQNIFKIINYEIKSKK